MKTSHTPGPWTINLSRWDEKAPVNGFYITAQGKVPYVASAGVACPNHTLVVDKQFRDRITTGFSEEEVEANSRLIAAAPDLLAVLEAVLDSMGALTNHSELENALGVDEAAKVFAAIAKAKGTP